MGLTHTVSGNIASFRTPSKVPIESLKFHFLPKQASGTPTPANPIPIEGWTGLNGRRSGKNLYSNYGLIYGKWILGTGEVQEALRGALTKEIPVSSGEEYSFSFNGSSYLPYSIEVVEYDKDKNYLRRNYSTKSEITAPPSNITFTVGSNTKYIVCGVFCSEESAITQEKIESYKMQLERGSVSLYEPYSGEQIPITFPVAGTNKADPNAIILEANLSLSDGIYSNTAVDTRAYSQLQIQLWKSTGTYIKSLTTINVDTTGTKSLTFEVDDPNCHYIAFKHNGAKKDFRILLPFNFGLGTYTLSVNLLSADPTVIGGFRFKDVQLEVGDTAHTFEPYSSNNTFYGGYVDPVAGEIVAEYAINKSNGTYWGIGASRVWQWYHSLGKTLTTYSKSNLCTHWINNKRAYYAQEDTVAINENGALCIGKNFFTDAGIDFDTITSETIEAYLIQLENSGTPFRVCYPLETPIHIPIAPQDMKAFLDHNNFQSDTNGITEVSYEVTESKDIQAARKRFEAEEDGHHKLVKWNQWCKELSDDYWKPYNATNISVAYADGVATQTWLSVGSGYTHSICTRANRQHYSGNYYYLSYEYCSDFNGQIHGTVGGENGESMSTTANVWSRYSCLVKRTTGGNMNNYIAYIGRFTNNNGISVGSTCKTRNPIAIDLTQMFGAGNEPTTVAEFERICALNDIDLTTYQPYDSGSDRWLIIP